MARYLKSTGRADVADAADAVAEHLTGDAEVYANPEQYFDQVIEIDLSTLEPHLNGPFTPDLATPISKMGELCAEKGYPLEISAASSVAARTPATRTSRAVRPSPPPPSRLVSRARAS